MSSEREIIKCKLPIDEMTDCLTYYVGFWNVHLEFTEAIYLNINHFGTDINYVKSLYIDILTENNKSITDRILINNYRGEDVKLIEINQVKGSIIIVIDIIFDEFFANYPRTEKLNNLQQSRLDEFDDFEKILNNETYSDVIINVSGKIFHAHKSILFSKSPVFEAMFKQEMKKNKENVVNIDDINPEVFMEILRFIYVAKVENLNNIADDLLPLANKYDLNGLKNLCGKYISDNLSIDNVFRYIRLATTYKVPVLKERAIKFVKVNRLKLNALQNTAMEETLKNADVKVVCEIIRALTLP